MVAALVAAALTACASVDGTDETAGDDATAANGTAGDETTAANGTGPPVRWQHQVISTDQGHTGAVQAEWASQVEEATNGAVSIEQHFSAGLGINDSELLSSLSGGSVDVAEFFGPSTVGEVPIANALELPFLLPFDVELRQEAVDLGRDTLVSAFAERGVRILAIGLLEPRNLYTTVPIDSLDDLQGLRIRTIGPIETALTEQLGAAAVTIDSAELYTSLQQGVADGYWFTHNATRDLRLFEVATHSWEIAQGGATWYVGIGQDQFEALPADRQQAVLDASQEMEAAFWDALVPIIESARGDLVEGGMTIETQVSEEDRATMRETSESLWDEWADSVGSEGAELLSALRDLVDESGA